MGDNPIDERLIVDNLFVVTARPDWYAGIMEFLTTQQLSGEWTKKERRNVRVNSRHFALVSHRLFRRGADGLLKRSVPEVEVSSTLVACRDSACGSISLANLHVKIFLEQVAFGLPCVRTLTITCLV